MRLAHLSPPCTRGHHEVSHSRRCTRNPARSHMRIRRRLFCNTHHLAFGHSHGIRHHKDGGWVQGWVPGLGRQWDLEWGRQWVLQWGL
jgi:hypothetical protein